MGTHNINVAKNPETHLHALHSWIVSHMQVIIIIRRGPYRDTSSKNNTIRFFQRGSCGQATDGTLYAHAHRGSRHIPWRRVYTWQQLFRTGTCGMMKRT